jgi:hypothetical protein
MLQILLAITLVILFFVIGFAIYNYEFLNSFRNSGVVKVSIPIFSGIKDFKNVQNEVYNTSERSSGSYRAINETPSFNQKAGSEFTYNFWLYKDSSLYDSEAKCSKSSKLAADSGFRMKNNDGSYEYTIPSGANGNEQTILFLKGDKRTVDYKNVCGKDKTDILVKGPLIKLEQCGKNLTVEFNTVETKDVVTETSPDVCNTTAQSWEMANAHKITLAGFDKPQFNKKWNMITVIIQDTYPSDPYPVRNKVRTRIYVNGLLELDRYVDGKVNTASSSNKGPTILQLNNGHLHIAPQVSFSNGSGNTYKTYKPVDEKALMIADLTYYNYALEASEIDSLFASDFTQAASAPPGGEVLTDADIYEKAVKPTKKQLIG